MPGTSLRCRFVDLFAEKTRALRAVPHTAENSLQVTHTHTHDATEILHQFSTPTPPRHQDQSRA